MHISFNRFFQFRIRVSLHSVFFDAYTIKENRTGQGGRKTCEDASRVISLIEIGS